MPKKKKFVYTEQVNVKVDPELKADIRYLSNQGIEINELLRPIIKETIRKAKEQFQAS